MEFTVTIAENDLPVLEWIRDYYSRVVTLNNSGELVQYAVDEALVKWRQEYANSLILSLQSILNEAPDEVKGEAVRALSVLQTLTPNEQVEQLAKIQPKKEIVQ